MKASLGRWTDDRNFLLLLLAMFLVRKSSFPTFPGVPISVGVSNNMVLRVGDSTVECGGVVSRRRVH